jgi:carbamoyl-phosphate synthase small subunit
MTDMTDTSSGRMTPAFTQPASPQPASATAVLVLADGSVFWGRGVGAEGQAVGEVCFNTGMTGYQETLSDPSYAGQIITFTFPHIGNIGVNDADMETVRPAARGLILREDITPPSNWRSERTLQDWLVQHGLVGISGLDTRALTHRIRDGGAPNGIVCHRSDKQFDIPALIRQAQDWPGLEGMDLAKDVTCPAPYAWGEPRWRESVALSEGQPHVVAVDFGAKRNILRCLVSAGCRVTVVPATATADQILAYKPDGVFLSNGPGDPAATGVYAVPMIRQIMDAGLPLFGICLGHQMLALALGGKTTKMPKGHRGCNHPVQDLATGKVEITSQNHGFMVLPETLPQGVRVSHVSLFDRSNEGICVDGKPIFSVQYHPEASPGPQDSHYLFDRFVSGLK